MFCHQCGAEVQQESKFCPYCGAKLMHINAQDDSRSVQEYRVDTPAGQAAEASQAESVAKQAELLGRAVGKAVHDKASQAFQATKDASTSMKAATGVATSGNDNRALLLALDIAGMAVVTFFPWIGSYLTEAKSLPGLVMDGLSAMSNVSNYSDYAYEYNAGSAYEAIMGFMTIVSIVAAVGWGATMYFTWKDASKDYKGEPSDGNGAVTLAATAVLAQIIVWLGVSAVKQKLQEGYFDLSFLGDNLVYATGWVWVALAIGVAGAFLRKSRADTNR